MITVSKSAAEQIMLSSAESKCLGTPLRIAIERRQDGSFNYLMGFDDAQQDGDQVFSSEGVQVVLDNASQQIGKGMLLDFIDLEGKMEFVFMNPNDPSYKPPEK